MAAPSNLESQCALQRPVQHRQFVGSRSGSELGDWYRAADLFVMSSWSEGLPNVLRESLACQSLLSPATSAASRNRWHAQPPFPRRRSRLDGDRNPHALAQPPRPGFPRPATWAESADALIDILRSAELPAAADPIVRAGSVSHFTRVMGWKAQ